MSAPQDDVVGKAYDARLMRRLLVYLPHEPHIGVSQRIGDENERQELRQRVQQLIHEGEKGGFIGDDPQLFAASGFDDTEFNHYLQWIFQFSFAATSTTIVSGSLAERT